MSELSFPVDDAIDGNIPPAESLAEPISVSVVEKCSHCRRKSEQSVVVDPVDVTTNPNEIMVGSFKCARCLKRNSLVLKDKERSFVENVASSGSPRHVRRSSSVRLVRADAQCWICKQTSKAFVSIEFQPRDVGDWAIGTFKCSLCLAQNNRKITLEKADELTVGSATILNSTDEHVSKPEKIIVGTEDDLGSPRRVESSSPRAGKKIKNKKSWTSIFLKENGDE